MAGANLWRIAAEGGKPRQKIVKHLGVAHSEEEVENLKRLRESNKKWANFKLGNMKWKFKNINIGFMNSIFLINTNNL